MCVFNFQDIYVIEYKRINHYDFKFLLKMRNPNRVDKKVIIRLWLVPTNRTSSTAKYHPTTGFVNVKCKKSYPFDFKGHTIPKMRLPLTALSTSWLEGTTKWLKGSQRSLPWPWKKQESRWKCQSKVNFEFHRCNITIKDGRECEIKQCPLDLVWTSPQPFPSAVLM